MGMEDPAGVSLIRPVVPEDQKQLVGLVDFPAERGDRRMGGVAGEGDDVVLRVGIDVPSPLDPLRHLEQLPLILRFDDQAGVVEVGFVKPDPGDGDGEFPSFLGVKKRQHMPPALEMLMVEDAAPDDREVAVGADEIKGEDIEEIEQTGEDMPVHRHRGVLFGEDDAMLRIIDVRGVLGVPRGAVESQADVADVLP